MPDDIEHLPWRFLLWLRVTMPLTKRLRRPTRGTLRLTEAIAARLGPRLPDGFTVEPDPTGLLGFQGPRAGGVITRPPHCTCHSPAAGACTRPSASN